MSSNSAFLIGLDHEEERRLSEMIGGDFVRLLALAQRVSWGITQSETVRVNVPGVCRLLEAEFGDCLPALLIRAYAQAHLGADARADALLDAALAMRTDNAFGYLCPTDAEWRGETPDAPFTEVVEGRIWRQARWIPAHRTRFSWPTVLTVIRVDSGELVVINPTEVDAEDLRDLGVVKWVLTPTAGHHMFIEGLSPRFPDAVILGVPRHRTESRSSHVSFDALVDGPTTLLPDELALVAMRGSIVDDVQLFHKPTKSLIATHLAVTNSADAPSFQGRLYAFTWGVHLRTGWLAYHPALWSDLSASQTGLREVMAWDFEHVFAAHGHVAGSKPSDVAALRASMEWAVELDSATHKRMIRSYFWQQPRFLMDLVRKRLFG